MEARQRTEDLIAENRAIVDDAKATPEQKEIAHEVLRTYGVEERHTRRASKKVSGRASDDKR